MKYKTKTPSNFNELLGNNIKFFRRRKKILSVKFAETIELDPAHFSRIENGKHSMSVYQLYLMRKKFGMDINKIFDHLEG